LLTAGCGDICAAIRIGWLASNATTITSIWAGCHLGGTHRRFRPNPSREGTVRNRLAFLYPTESPTLRYRILHNQRGPLLATTIRARIDAVVATLSIRLD
jgi:hypothetical protein